LFTEQTVTEDHYFHISKADLVQMEMEEHNVTYVDAQGKHLSGMQAKLQKIVDSQDGKAIMDEVRDIIRRSYGKKEGDRFLKSEAIWTDFASTEAYSQLVFDLCTDADQAAEFMTGVVPSNLEQIVDEVRAQAEQNGNVPPEATPRVLTQDEIVAMDREELKSGLEAGKYKLS